MKLKELGAFLALSFAWGSSFLWIKIAVSEMGPFTLVALRVLFGILGLLVVVAYQRPPLAAYQSSGWYWALSSLTNEWT